MNRSIIELAVNENSLLTALQIVDENKIASIERT